MHIYLPYLVQSQVSVAVTVENSWLYGIIIYVDNLELGYIYII